MRQIGTLSSEREAATLVDFLLTCGIISQADAGEGDWVIWVREENQLDAAQRILAEFRQNPTDPKYAGAKRQADQLRSETQRRRATVARQTVDMRRRWSQPLSRRAPLVMALIGLSIFASLATRFAQDPQSSLLHVLMFGDTRPILPSQPYDPLQAIKHGQLWRMITPIFLHGDILHLLFNMWWLYALGTQLESRLGTVRLGVLVLVFALVSNWAQFLIGQSPLFMGMSGVVYGIFGYMWIRLKIEPGVGYLLSEGTVFLMMFVLVLGFAGILHGIANWAHVGGLLAGMAIAYGSAKTGRVSG